MKASLETIEEGSGGQQKRQHKSFTDTRPAPLLWGPDWVVIVAASPVDCIPNKQCLNERCHPILQNLKTWKNYCEKIQLRVTLAGKQMTSQAPYALKQWLTN